MEFELHNHGSINVSRRRSNCTRINLSTTLTTCQVVSVPATTWTIVYSSGDARIYPATTFTAVTTVTESESATIRAQCYTLTPGETSHPSFAGIGVTCSSNFYSRGTEFITYTSGEVNPIFRTTHTVDSTATIIIEPTNDVTYDVLSDYQNIETCHTISSLTWASLVVTFVSVQLTWWIFDVPLIWKQDAGFRVFLDVIAWACVRSHAPGSAGIIAASKGSSASDFARIYYLGLKRQATPADWKTWKLYSCIGTDLLSITATIITIYQACTLPQYDARRNFGLSLWVYPSLPVALIGLTLLVGERFFPHTPRGNLLLLAFILLVLVLAAMAVSLALWKFDTTDGNGTWWISIIFYVLMVLPVVYIRLLMAFWCVAAWMVRVGGVSLAALQHYSGGQPYCEMRGLGFAIVYMVLGGIAAVLALFGGFYHAGLVSGFRQFAI